MNIVAALEHLGYQTPEDFEYYINGTLIWKSADPQPSVSQIAEAWEEYDAISIVVATEERKRFALRKVEEIAEKKRLEYVTGGSAQSMVYEQKYREAKSFLTEGGDLSEYPFIAMEAPLRNMTPTAFATFIIDRRNQWAQIGAAIEQLRFQAKAAIKATDDEAEIASIIETYTADIEAI